MKHEPAWSEADARTYVEQLAREHQLFANSRYQVAVRRVADGAVHLSIKRIDQQAIHDWRDLQRIRNELVRPECESVELYPAESRVVDVVTQFHLWCSDDPQFRFA